MSLYCLLPIMNVSIEWVIALFLHLYYVIAAVGFRTPIDFRYKMHMQLI